MALIFNSQGHVVVVDPHADSYYDPAQLSIPSLTASVPAGSTFLLGFDDLSKSVAAGLQRTLGNDLYVYTAGTYHKPLAIHGVCFNPNASCGATSTTNGANIIFDWFDSYRAWVGRWTYKSISVIIGDTTYNCLLLNCTVKPVKPHLPLFAFTATVYPLGTS